MAIKRRGRRKRGQGVVASLRDPQKIRGTYIIVVLVFVFGGSLGFGAARCNKDPGLPGQGDDMYVARIEDHNIPRRDFLLQFEMQKPKLEAQYPGLHGPEFNTTNQYTVLRQMIDMEYFDIRATEAGLVVTDQEIEARIEQFRSRIVPPEEVEEQRSLLQRALDSLGSVRKEQAFERALQRSGTNLTQLRQAETKNLLASKYLNELLEAKREEMINERGVFASTVRSEIEAGREFSDAAAEYSNHEGSKAAGGLIPLLKRSDETLPGRVIDTAFILPVGEISQPIAVGRPPELQGVWIVTVISRKEAAGDEWNAALPVLRQELLELKRQQAQAGEIEMPPDGNIVVTDEEVTAEYEEATIRVIYFATGDPMEHVAKDIQDDIDSMDIEIFDDDLRATHHISRSEWRSAAEVYQEALRRNNEQYDEDDGETWSRIDIRESHLRYMIANMWSTVAFSFEQEFYTKAYEAFMADPEAFGGEFPSETPEDVRVQQQIFFVMALINLDRTLELDPDDPWAHLQRSQIDLARTQVIPRMLDDMEAAHEYFQNDIDLCQQILSQLQIAASLDDAALETTGDVRPETWVPPVLPEDEMGLTLESIDALFPIPEETVGEVEPVEEIQEPPPPDNAPVDTGEVVDIADTVIDDESETETGIEPIEELETEPGEIAEPELIVEPEVEEEPEVLSVQDTLADLDLPELPVPEPAGPLTQDLRDRLDALIQSVQTNVDELRLYQAEMEARQEAMMQQQIEDLDLNFPLDEEPPSEEATDLLESENE